MGEEKINMIMILEMLGRPADYAKQTMKSLINKNLASEKGVEILNSKVSEPKQIQEQNLFSLFAEVELNLESVEDLLVVVFRYMPSHIEIITPEVMRIKNDELNLFANELTKKLHQYDEIAKTLTMEKNILKQQLEARGEKPIEIFQKQKADKKIKKKKVKKKR